MNTARRFCAATTGAAIIHLLFCLQAPAGLPQRNSAPLDSGNQRIFEEFDSRVKDYVKLREGLEKKLPKLSDEAKAEEIETYKTTFEESVRVARAGAKRGDLFTAQVARHIRATIRSRFKGADLQQLRETILEAETKGVPVRVNYSYPAHKELTQIPPTLLMVLPQLPKEVKYRFVGRHLLLVDTGNGLIIDFMLDALP